MLLINELITSTLATLYMVFVSTLISVLIGTALGIILFATQQPQLWPKPLLYRTLSGVVNGLRSIPFIILLIILLPLTRLIVGTSIGTTAAIVPLSIAAIPLFARLVDNALAALPNGLIEAGLAIGATPFGLLRRCLIPEIIPELLRSTTLLAITLIGYSAMAGTVGGGGLGDFAIRYGYQQFNTAVMIETVVILIGLVQLIQTVGDKFVNALNRSHT